MKTLRVFSAALCGLWMAGAISAASAKVEKDGAAPAPLNKLYEGLEFRNIGPFRGGRVTAVAGVRGEPLVYYQGATGGGIWKTVDGGSNWQPMSDKYFKTGSVGAIGIAESDPNVIYVGMGEAPIRGNVSHGDGVYKSTDGGKTWKNVGLKNTYQISRVRVHPKNPDIAYVAALGHVWGANSDRGIFRTIDGGRTWEKVLFVSDKTGASDLCMDPNNPRILYAGLWQVSRKPWSLESGGSEGGLYRSIDGGDTWKKLAGGLPEGVVGNIGVAISGARPDRIWAIVEAEKGGVFRSDDGGEKWTKTNSENKLRQRAWYYSKIYADPKNTDEVYVLNTGFYRSNDGGKSFNPIRVPHGDNHDLWLDPDNADRMIESNDGGANVSFNGGRTWSSIMNQPTAQFYRVITDDRFPYWIYGAQQDNSTVAIASRGRGRGIDVSDWHDVGGGESGWIAPKPGTTGNVVYAGSYGGSIDRYDHTLGQRRQVVAWPENAIGQAPKDTKYRFQWNAPIVISPHDPNTIYHGAQVLLRSRDEGQSWEEISPDLTRNDKAKQGKSGGPITKDDTGVEVYDTIFYVVESKQEAGTIWVGTDDGLVQVTRDGGKNWQNVTPKGLPDWIRINSIDLSEREKGTAYVAATRYQFDDFRPYLYKTSDYGKTWTKIVHGIPENAFTRVVREDPRRHGMLYAGTELGLFVSFDDGGNWQPLQLNLPVVPITDMTIKDNDLIVATQGRAFWVLDDLTPLHEYRDGIAREGIHLFPPRPTVRMGGGGFGGGEDEDATNNAFGKNPANGVQVSYFLRSKPKEKEILTVEFLDGDTVLRKYTSEKKERDATDASAAPEDDRADKPIEPKEGLNRLVWDMRVMKPTLVPKAIIWGNSQGPRVAPGKYTVRLKYGAETLTAPFEVRAHPGVSATAEDLKKQFDLLRDSRNGLTAAHEAVASMRDVRAQIRELGDRAEKLGKGKELKDKGKAISDKVTALEKKLVNPELKSSQDVLNFAPALDHQFAGLASVASSSDAKPTDASWVYLKQIQGKLDGILGEWKSLQEKDLAEFNKAVREKDIPPVVVVPKKEEGG
ncbi:MAG: glycosyl hydrolase [Acidobacteria bacterium]|nr:glycosyl hydrolase [Acidobacteriota bacterium]MCA1609856.1 glycosyl hydrolase [Acidobacteriota bacterium]